MNKIVPLYTAKTIITLDICKKTTLTISRKIKLEITALVALPNMLHPPSRGAEQPGTDV